nr:MAG TPA: hypothetical protein [Caudoviricetes sp.]
MNFDTQFSFLILFNLFSLLKKFYLIIRITTQK